MSYRPYLESGALQQMHGLPEQAFDMLVALLVRICDDPYDPVFSAPTGVPRRRVADVGDFGSSCSWWTKLLVWSAFRPRVDRLRRISVSCPLTLRTCHTRNGATFRVT